MMKEGVFKAVELGESDSTVIFEDDGKTAYAYLLKAGKIVSDVWLYNCLPAPETAEWDKKENAPFLNPREYASDENFPRIENEAEIKFAWYTDEKTGSVAAEVILRGVVFAQLEPGRKPSWSRLAKKDGPFALRLIES